MYGNWTLQNRFHGWITNQSGAPGGALGTAVVPGLVGVYGTYTQILAATAYETCLVMLHIHDGAVSAASRNMLINIGVDEAGGTAYVAKIPHLLSSAASPYMTTGAGIFYVFPLYIPSGATVAAQATVNNATVGTVKVGIRLYGRPSRPESVCCGSYITSFGDVLASSTGTTVTPGTTSEGAYVQLGSNTTRDHWWWQLGPLVSNDTNFASASFHQDLAYGDATNKHLIFEDVVTGLHSGEAAISPPWVLNAFLAVPSGVSIYGRAQANALEDNHQMLAYGLGG